MKALALIPLFALATGCVEVTRLPDSGRLELEHVSHPLAGWPVSAANTEDALTQANLVLRWDVSKRVFIEQGLGYNIQGANGGGFYGPAFTYTGRVGVTLFGGARH